MDLSDYFDRSTFPRGGEEIRFFSLRWKTMPECRSTKLKYWPAAHDLFRLFPPLGVFLFVVITFG